MNTRPLLFVAAFLFSSLSLLVAEPAPDALLKNISTEQYCAFLNAVETTGGHQFYHSEIDSNPAAMRIRRSLAEDRVHFTYSFADVCGDLPITDISWRDIVCYSNWLSHDCPTGDAVTDEVLCTPLDPNSDPSAHDDGAILNIAAPASIRFPVTNTDLSIQPKEKPHASSYSSYFYNGLKAVTGVTEWTFWNVGGEVIEAVVLNQLGLYALVPYCAYMGAVIFHEYENQEYYGAAGTILHALFDIVCIIGNRIGFDVVKILGSCLENCGLKCVADFCVSIHSQIDNLLHALGIEHSHGGGIVEDDAAAEPLREEIASGLENMATRPFAQCKECSKLNCAKSQNLSFNLDAAYWKQFETDNEN